MKNIVEAMDENNNENKLLIRDLDGEPGYYSQVIRSMLAPGHETELIYWFRSVGLIPNTQTCDNAKLDEACKAQMEWTPVKTVEYYQWRCRNCRARKSIREASFFQDVKCSFKNLIRMILGWCKSYEVDAMANILGIKKHIVRSLYYTISAAARIHLKEQLPNTQIGGPHTIVIVDTFPEGCSNLAQPIRGSRSILCIAEVKEIPPNYWFEPLQRFSRFNVEQISAIKSHILNTIREIVRPGSILVTRSDSRFCSRDDLEVLKDLYPTIVSADTLARHDCDDQNIYSNLETIWKRALEVCVESQYLDFDQIPNFLMSQMWQYRFRQEAFEILLHRLTDPQ